MGINPNSTEGKTIDQLAADQADDADRTRYKPDWSRQDRPHYGDLKEEGHEKAYENWRSTSRIPALPAWKEMDNASRASWMTSTTGSKVVGDARRAFIKSNFSEKAGRAVVTSPESRPNNAKTTAEVRVRTGLKEAVKSGNAEIVDASSASSINALHGFSNDFSHHEKLGNLVDRLEKAHNGTNSSVPALAAAARKSLSDSIYSQGTGVRTPDREAALKHFSDAAGHTMRLAAAVAGAAHNSGEPVNAQEAMTEANTHMTNYREHVTNIKKVN